MDTLEVIYTRRSIRKYRDIPVEWDKVGKILEAGRAAPSAGNIQAWKFVVITDPAKIRMLAEAALQQYWMGSAKVHIIVVSQFEKHRRFYGVRGERLYAIQDCAAACQNMLLAAHYLGLGACWVGAFDEDGVKRAVMMPEQARPQAIITLGYADEEPPVPTKYKLEQVTMIERWKMGQQIKDIAITMGYPSLKVGKYIEKTKEFIGNLHDKIAKRDKK
ncbi:nitroreductase family protein [Candidatus Woesearchaeota archaeon]|nr:nitroreductase family protein [Candidatus Woesearchaeota archaeon]